MTRRVALITGASGGVGSALARAFAADGWTLALHCGAREARARRLAAELRRAGGKAEVFRADFRDLRRAQALVERVTSKLGRLDLLVNNAASMADYRDFLELSPAAWEEAFRVNVTAVFLLSREAFKAMKRRGGGRIINISSIAAKYGGSPKSLHHGASKAAVEAITAGLARFGAPHKILVNAIRLGVIDTDIHRRLKRDMKSRVRLIPLKRMGRPEEVARMAVFLAGPGGSFITGQVLPVTGGE
ncbi:MAG: SDR family oxidoreductase [Elusimicrobia bacterium]|nr:SDR family oxidoreductase [Elusimicrobiota bacterium]